MGDIDFDKVFDGFGEADPTGRGPKIDCAGKFIVEINEVRLRESENPQTRGHVFFIVVHTVIASDTEKVLVGREFTWTNDLMNEFFGMSNCKQFLSAVLGMEASSPEAQALGKQHIKEAVEEGSFIGEKVRLTTQPKMVGREEVKRPFTIHTWSPYFEKEGEAVAG